MDFIQNSMSIWFIFVGIACIVISFKVKNTKIQFILGGLFCLLLGLLPYFCE